MGTTMNRQIRMIENITLPQTTYASGEKQKKDPPQWQCTPETVRQHEQLKKTLSIELHWFIQCVLLKTKEKVPILQSRTSINFSYKEIKPGHSPDLKKNSHRLVVCPKTLWSLGTETTKASVTRFICCFPKFSKFNLCSQWIHFLCAPP